MFSVYNMKIKFELASGWIRNRPWARGWNQHSSLEASPKPTIVLGRVAPRATKANSRETNSRYVKFICIVGEAFGSSKFSMWSKTEVIVVSFTLNMSSPHRYRQVNKNIHTTSGGICREHKGWHRQPYLRYIPQPPAWHGTNSTPIRCAATLHAWQYG